MRRNRQHGDLESLARRAARGDRHAFAMVCAAIEPDIWRYCRSVLRDHAAAEDAAQETFARIVTAIGRYRGDAPVRSWAIVIARRVCSDAIRRRARTDIPVDQQHEDTHHPVTALHRSHLRTVEQDALLDQLSTDDRTAFVLTQLLGFDYAEAAAIADVPIGTIRSRVHRARNHLARLWNASTHADDDSGQRRNTVRGGTR